MNEPDQYAAGLADGLTYLLMQNVNLFLPNPVACNNAVIAIARARLGLAPPRLAGLPFKTGLHDWRAECEALFARLRGDASEAARASLRAAAARGPGPKFKSDTEWSRTDTGETHAMQEKEEDKAEGAPVPRYSPPVQPVKRGPGRPRKYPLPQPGGADVVVRLDPGGNGDRGPLTCP